MSASTAPEVELFSSAENREHWVSVFRDLHANPELAGQEFRTAGILAGELLRCGFEVTEAVGGTGVVALLRNGPGPTVMLRGDMDALPIKEVTDLAWRSEVTQLDQNGETVPVMHACGHDMHVTALAAAAEQLASQRDTWSGTLMIVGQPAEEPVTGARAMLEDGLFRRFPKPDVALGQHVANAPVGMLGYSEGVMMAASTSMDVELRESTAGGGDVITAAAYAITRLQELVPRAAATDDAIVVTVGVFQGTRDGQHPGRAALSVNVRAHSDESMGRTLHAVQTIITAENDAAGLDLPPVFAVTSRAPATINHPALARKVLEAQRAALPAVAAVPMPILMGSEDFPEYGIPGDRYDGDPVPTVFWFWGGADRERLLSVTGDPNRLVGNSHCGDFELTDAPTIAIGRGLLVAAALACLNEPAIR